MNPSPKFQEEYSAKIPALALLTNLGWTFLPPDQALAKRGNKYDEVVLRDELRQVLQTRRFRFEGREQALSDKAVDKLIAEGKIKEDPIEQKVAAISCGIYQGTPVLDLDYDEDSNAGADANFVLTADGALAEVQATAEGETFDEEGLLRLLRLARIGCAEIFAAQDRATGR